MVGATIYKSKKQSITADSSTETEFIATHSTSKLTCSLCMLLKQIRHKQTKPTPIYIDNLPTLQMIHDN